MCSHQKVNFVLIFVLFLSACIGILCWMDQKRDKKKQRKIELANNLNKNDTQMTGLSTSHILKTRDCKSVLNRADPFNTEGNESDVEIESEGNGIEGAGAVKQVYSDHSHSDSNDLYVTSGDTTRQFTTKA